MINFDAASDASGKQGDRDDDGGDDDGPGDDGGSEQFGDCRRCRRSPTSLHSQAVPSYEYSSSTAALQEKFQLGGDMDASWVGHLICSEIQNHMTTKHSDQPWLTRLRGDSELVTNVTSS